MKISCFSRRARLAVALFTLASTSAFAVGVDRTADREALRKALSEVLERGVLKTARVTVEVRSLEDGAVIFSHNPDDLLNPASNVKLFTAAASLVKLGTDFRYETEFLADGDWSTGKARNLYVRGHGDPTVTTEKLFNWVGELFHIGLRDISGDIVIDDSWFDAERTAPGFDQETSDRAYMAPTGAVSLNANTVGIYLRAGRNGQKAAVEVEPPSDYFVVDNQLAAGARKFKRFAVTSEPAADKQKITIKGTLSLTPGQSAVWKKIDNPPLYFGQTLKALLAEHGIKLHGRVKVGPVQNTARVIYLAQSDTLDLVLKRMNKNSSNFVAETLIKTMGAEVKGTPGSFAKGVAVVEEFLEHEVGIPRGSYVMKNGSGLNDTNRFSSAQVNKLLRTMYERFPLAPEYMSSMGIAGKDGTVRYRFEGTDAVGRLRAKTGTLENVSALSGYVQSVGGERFIFSTMVNDYAGKLQPVVQSIDALGIAVAASGSRMGPTRAVAEAMTQQTVVAPLEEAKARIKTYLALGKQGDKRNISFLRTAWRNEKDPAVRAVVAESIYRSNPQDYLGARELLDSLSGGDDVYGRLRRVAKDLAIEVPGVSALVEMAAEGNAEALSKMLELAKAALGDESSEKEMSASFSEVARTAPEELLHAMRAATPPEREAGTKLLARGLVDSADGEHPFWPALRKEMGSLEPGIAGFAKQMDETMSLRIAQAKAPKPTGPSTAAPQVKGPPQTAETRPGG